MQINNCDNLGIILGLEYLEYDDLYIIFEKLTLNDLLNCRRLNHNWKIVIEYYIQKTFPQITNIKVFYAIIDNYKQLKNKTLKCHKYVLLKNDIFSKHGLYFVQHSGNNHITWPSAMILHDNDKSVVTTSNTDRVYTNFHNILWDMDEKIFYIKISNSMEIRQVPFLVTDCTLNYIQQKQLISQIGMINQTLIMVRLSDRDKCPYTPYVLWTSTNSKELDSSSSSTLTNLYSQVYLVYGTCYTQLSMSWFIKGPPKLESELFAILKKVTIDVIKTSSLKELRLKQNIYSSICRLFNVYDTDIDVIIKNCSESLQNKERLLVFLSSVIFWL